MKTEIYFSYYAFLGRTNKKTNGVSESFVADNPAYENQNATNEGCWSCRGCSDCSGCRGCSHIGWLNDKKNLNPEPSESSAKSWFDVPKIENIHAKILAATKEDPANFDMSTWHQNCGTTHCRGGWAVTMAGKKGRALEAASSTLFAAMQIYKASSPIRVSPVRFFEGNAVAMADMERCAAEEAALKGTT